MAQISWVYQTFLFVIVLCSGQSLIQIPHDKQTQFRKLLNTGGMFSSAYIFGLYISE